MHIYNFIFKGGNIMSNRSKKVVIDALGLYRLNAVDVLCCKESLDAFKANNDFTIEFG